MVTKSEAPGPPTLPRAAYIAQWVAAKSHFLFGPRQTGKPFLVRAALPEAKVYDLLDSAVFLALSTHPGRLGEELRSDDALVVIDEIQRQPALLNEVHRLIETRGTRFLLTGSSARSLRRGVNLLGGRARTRRLHPLCRRELGEHFDLTRALRRGLLPSIYFSDDPNADLAAYTGTYLQQEIVSASDLRSLRALAEENKLKRYLCVSMEPRRREVEGIVALPYEAFLSELWASSYC